MTTFKHPLVTYLTSKTFAELGNGLEHCAMILKEQKVNLYELHAMHYFLNILKANFLSLRLCQINLNSLLPRKQNYEVFMKAFQNFVVKVTQEGKEIGDKRSEHYDEQQKIEVK